MADQEPCGCKTDFAYEYIVCPKHKEETRMEEKAKYNLKEQEEARQVTPSSWSERAWCYPGVCIPPQRAADYDNRFTYHPPKPELNQTARYESIREKARQFALYLADQCPESRELSLAITKLEEVVMWANSSIARHE